jgi:hypothetical protein
MTDGHRLSSLVAVALGLGLMVILIWLAPAMPVRANPGLQCVNETGSGCDPACGGCYNAIQKAIDHAAVGDEIRIAGGAYTMTAGTVARIEKELQIIGGYDPACSVFDADLYPTVLDGQGMGPVVEIDHAGDVSLMHLNIIGGNGTGNCGADGCGGGIYVETSILHVGHCLLANNMANEATGYGRGGGLYAVGSAVEIWESHIVNNTAQANPATSSGGYGGGLYIGEGTATLRQNLILDNLAHALWSGYGGGVYLQSLDHADVLTNVIEANRGNPPGSNYGSYGGGVYVNACPSITLAGNLLMGNFSKSQGGGIFADWSRPHLARNRVMGNTSTAGAGIMIKGSTPVTLSNNLVAHNAATARAGGVLATNVTPPGPQVHLFNNTLADNEPAGVATWNYASLSLINNLLAGNPVGISESEPASSTVTADYNLFWNGSDPIVGSNALIEEPGFAYDYHLGASSPALDAGLDLPWLTVDLDGNPRPRNMAWDLGAFEGARHPVCLPLVARNYPQSLTPIFDDDFDDGNLAGWTRNLGTWTNPGDHMRGQYDLGNAWNIHSSTGSNVIYEGTVNLLSGNAAGLVFRSSADGMSSYDAILDAYDNVFKISKRQPYQVLDSHAMVVQRNHPYQIKVVANGSTIQAYLDGVPLLTATDTDYSSGHLGVMLFRATATYDDLRAWATP